MKVAVTGASGFIGAQACIDLARRGHQVVPIALRHAELEHALQGVQAVVHLAGIAHRHAQREELQEVNVRLTEHVARRAAAAGARVIFLSSVKALAPQDPYAESKARAEEALRAVAGLGLTVLQPPLVYGAGVKANFLRLMRAIARGWPLPLASIENRRSLVYVGNLCDAIARCLESAAAAGKTYLVADGAALSTPALCRAIGAALERPARLFPFPPAWLPVRSLTASLEVDDSLIRRELHWKPPSTLDEGLRDTARWYRGL